MKIPAQIIFAFLICLLLSEAASSASGEADEIAVQQTADFAISGKGDHENWTAAEWVILPFRSSEGSNLPTRLKCLYSEKGLYFLFSCRDQKITAGMDSDFADLWKEDVVEIFLWPDTSFPIYFEYELSPLNRELVLLVPNLKGDFWGWRPWHYEGERRVVHLTTASGGSLRSGAEVDSWTAEIFIPYALLKPLSNVPPQPGAVWRANFYRGDYDSGQWVYWAWRPIEKRFHEFQKFGRLIFK
ncbi:MAG: hypothetical protein Kow0042_00390 [Calditrichia bacterium]